MKYSFVSDGVSGFVDRTVVTESVDLRNHSLCYQDDELIICLKANLNVSSAMSKS
jgi:hypothetical protein